MPLRYKRFGLYWLSILADNLAPTAGPWGRIWPQPGPLPLMALEVPMASPDSRPTIPPTARLMGSSPAMVALRAQIHHLAAFDGVGNRQVPTGLLHGGTGTGKGVGARGMHERGPP